MFEHLSFPEGTGSYAIYLRKSRKDLEAEAKGEGETLTRHLQILTELAQHLNLHIEKVYAEVVSGESIQDRPRMQALLHDVEASQYDGVLVAEIERLARGDTSDQGRVAKAFQFSHTKIITPAKTYDPEDEYDEEYFEFGLFMSRREYKAIRRRLLAGTKASCKEGKYTGSIAPYGYERCKLSREKGWSLSILPDQANVVRMIFHWYLYGIEGTSAGYGKIAQKLNQLGIASPSGALWTSNGVQNILRNPVYAGYIKHGYRKKVKKLVDGQLTHSRPLSHDCTLFPGRHTPIISEEVWQAVHMRQHSKLHDSSAQYRLPQNPLSGLIRCGHCGRIMQRKANPFPTEATLLCPTPGCPTVSSSLKLVEQRILEAITLCLHPHPLPAPAIPSGITEQTALLKDALTSCQQELKTLSIQLTHQYELLEQGVYTQELFLSRREQTLVKKETLTSRLHRLTEELQSAEQHSQPFQGDLPFPWTFSDIYEALTSPSVKNCLLKQLIDYIIYTKPPESRGWPDRFTLEVFLLF